MRRILMMFAFLLASAASFAMPSPADVAKAVGQNDWPRAEALLKDVLKERNSAKAHYQLGQVYSHEFRHGEALAEFKQARAIDPSLKFASSEKLFLSLLEKEQAMVDGKLDEQPMMAAAHQEAPKPNGEIKIPQAVAVSPATAVAVAKPPASEGFDSGWLIAGIVAVLVAVVLFFVLKNRDGKRADEKEKQRLADKAKAQLGEILPLSNQLRDAELECKTASYDTGKKEAVLEKLGALRADILSAITTIKDGMPVDASKLQDIKTNGADALKAVKTGVWPSAQASESTRASWASRTNQESSGSSNQHRSTNFFGKERPSYERTASPPPQAQVQPQTVVARESSNDGLLTGLLLGSMMSHDSRSSESPRHSERYSRDESYSSRRDDDDSRRSSPSFDFGSSSSSSSDSSSSFDSGSGSDWT
ncbi:tetratricopeptide repeat protein [Ralstonia pseudosolanacearum]|uniref:tetratricopeptide repeat protein n=1 Tax=Ralstonia pseudosolanacearum TaxID=1310165 RepID=UPI00270527E5|nr:tetratricopeptide repeat protein [Ralstonia pseudosolanacearum]MDO3615374.1 tetratricopeptide repeat protein [Ralstonia pseudosolanacearum]